MPVSLTRAHLRVRDLPLAEENVARDSLVQLFLMIVVRGRLELVEAGVY
jgi:hypothetical protein